MRRCLPLSEPTLRAVESSYRPYTPEEQLIHDTEQRMINPPLVPYFDGTIRHYMGVQFYAYEVRHLGWNSAPATSAWKKVFAKVGKKYGSTWRDVYKHVRGYTLPNADYSTLEVRVLEQYAASDAERTTAMWYTFHATYGGSDAALTRPATPAPPRRSRPEVRRRVHPRECVQLPPRRARSW